MSQFRWPCVLVLLTLILAAKFSVQSAQGADPPGKSLFVERWASHDKRSIQGDGLGPLHNATSCAACHHQAGAGGGGDRRHNVELLSLVPVDARKTSALDFTKRVIALHPGFKIGNTTEIRPNIVLHRFGSEADYFDLRARLKGIEEPLPDVGPNRRAVIAAEAKRRPHATPVETLDPVDGISFQLSQRNTPALWGDGLIDAIADTVIQENANAQKRDAPKVAGRVPLASGGGVGRFGWRGQTATLREFVLNACANELGLQTKDHPQPVNPLTPDYQPTGQDLSDNQVDALVSFVNNLPRPIEARPTTTSASSVAKGEHVFERIGCAVCHPRDLGKISGLFSDMLLHDMGPGLADPVEPNSEVELVAMTVSGYSGRGTIFVEQKRPDPSLPRLWKTPPLWGVADSAPYLHDGRAVTLNSAIKQHGGQAADSATKYGELPSAERANLIAFLETLTAPKPPAGK